jgi:hypothetical protein
VNPAAWLKSHKPEAALGGGGILVALILYERSKKNGGGGSANQSYAMPATTANTTSTDALSGMESQILGLQQAFLGTQGGSKAATPATPANNGFGQESFGGKNYDQLGNVTNGLFNGFNVGGGEPVFYDVGGTLQTNLSPEQISGLPPGTEVLTVAQAGQQGQISGTAVSGEKIGK